MRPRPIGHGTGASGPLRIGAAAAGPEYPARAGSRGYRIEMLGKIRENRLAVSVATPRNPQAGPASPHEAKSGP